MNSSGPGSMPWRLYRLFFKAHMAGLQRVVGRRPVPLGYWRAIGRLSGAESSYEQTLSPLLYEPEQTATDFAAPDLRGLLAGRTLGSWSLDVDTIDYVWGELKTQRPAVVIECGAGTSTHLFAAHFKQLVGSSPAMPPVVSLEQDLLIARSVEEELRQAGAGGLASVMYFPLDHQFSYSVDADAMLAAMGGRRADWVFIDGPAGHRGGRWRTLIDLMRYARTGARWFLDDALRLDELGVLSLWERYPGIKVDGIIPVGKGLATGTLTAPECCDLSSH